jgi:hypothetical protein
VRPQATSTGVRKSPLDNSWRGHDGVKWVVWSRRAVLNDKTMRTKGGRPIKFKEALQDGRPGCSCRRFAKC